MRVTAELVQSRRTESVDLPAASTGFDLFRRLGLAPDAHLLVRGDTPIPLDETLVDAEHLEIISVVSGGTQPAIPTEGPYPASSLLPGAHEN